MNEEQRTAHIIASAVRALLRALGMFSENMQRAYRGESLSYGEETFLAILEEEELGVNSIVKFLTQSRKDREEM